MSYLSRQQIRAIKDLPDDCFPYGVHVTNVHDVTYAMEKDHRPMRYSNGEWSYVVFENFPTVDKQDMRP